MSATAEFGSGSADDRARAAGLAGAGAFSGFEWLLAGRYLRARRKEGFISIIAGFSFLGIMLGVATLITVMSVLNGFREELLSKILGLNGHVIVHKIGGPFDDYDEVASRIATIDGIKAALPLIEGQAMVAGPSQSAGVFVRGMRADDISKLDLVAGNLLGGTLEGFDEGNGIALGSRLANTLGVIVGDTVTLVNPRGQTTVFGTRPNIQAFPVVAVFEIGMSEYDKTIAFMPLAQAQSYFNQPESVSVIEVLADQPESLDALKDQMRVVGGPTIFLADWRERNSSFFTVLQVERNMMFIILSLIVLVAALNIISGLMMLVKDKGRDIAILRTMGATKGAVMRVFLITGASIGVVGTIAGLLLGIFLTRNLEPIRQGVAWLTGTTIFDPDVYFLSRLPASIDPTETAAVVLMALTLSVLATLYPSWRASRLDPVKALRYE